MRCGACDVDLNEDAAGCPLCGGPALEVPPRIAGVEFQEYPVYGRATQGIKNRPSAGKFLLWAAAVLSLPLLWARGWVAGLAALALMGSAALLPVILRNPQRRERHLVFLLLFAALSVAGFGAALWMDATVMPLSGCALVLAFMNLTVLRVLCGGALAEELRARFYF